LGNFQDGMVESLGQVKIVLADLGLADYWAGKTYDHSRKTTYDLSGDLSRPQKAFTEDIISRLIHQTGFQLLIKSASATSLFTKRKRILPDSSQSA